MYSEKISVCPLTTHIQLKDVEKNINREIIESAIKNLNIFYNLYFHKTPKITVVCLNPHCSDNGLLGKKDIEIETIVKKYNNIIGPIAPDTAFNSDIRNNTDVYLCMYHDQALIPFKILSFEDGINITIGLDFLRISPDHGPAYDKIDNLENVSLKSFENSINFIIKKAP